MPTTKKKPTKRAAKSPAPSIASLEARIAALEHHNQSSWLLGDHFWKRAFAVIGHHFSAMFALWVGMLMLLLASVVLAGVLTFLVSLFN
ncbi:hypothetical protein COV06_01585 [Candidatus Uhrbacteria bacterium CG10_big_fil_rev_8_21_14_0_10_50_16]|uniref:Uncharacterized protein n=1 Tax=Candidatus Uhrbacteria bacterium CG10_big_fil_rev_8_21_14_0_10_50_16 TaxID=1975039 RepID=A0A2H0RNF4_9BACT|nr:MAG: hypothetical protein COV06_01585 [Candidatus Uhrbacteria bacterium CG10_big_fil_rev_8_21_14_0_10_50_16]